MIVIFNPFDVATKELIWDDPAAWLEKLGVKATDRSSSSTPTSRR